MYSTGSGMYTLPNETIFVVSEHSEYLYFVNVCFIIKTKYLMTVLKKNFNLVINDLLVLFIMSA